MNTIALTREGYSYQDKIAVLLYLRNFLEGNLREYYVDYSFGKRSFDIYFVDKDENPHIFEVKSGLSFHNDLEDINHSLETFQRHIETGVENSIYYLIVKKEFRDKLSQFWSSVRIVNERSPQFSGFTESISFLIKKISIPDLKARGKLIPFIKRIHFDSYYDNKPLFDAESSSDIDNQVLGLIHQLTINFQIRSLGFDYPPEILMRELYLLAQTGAGKDNLYEKFVNTVCDFVAHCRTMQDPAYAFPANREQLKIDHKQDIYKEVKERYQTFKTLPQPDIGIQSPEEMVVDKVSDNNVYE